MSRIYTPLKSMCRWKSELWELKCVVAHRGESSYYKRNLSRARRRYRGDLNPFEWGSDDSLRGWRHVGYHDA